MDDDSTIPREVEDILVELRILTNIPPGCKYNVHNKSYISSNSLLSKLTRTYYHWRFNEKRITTLEEFRNKINKAVKIAHKYPDWAPAIKKQVAKLKKNGLDNQIREYTDDPEIESRFRVFRDNINLSSFDIKEKK
jgi:hypothetical protein